MGAIHSKVINANVSSPCHAAIGKSPNLRPKITFDLIRDWDQGSRGV
jgi:hypothetical protein